MSNFIDEVAGFDAQVTRPDINKPVSQRYTKAAIQALANRTAELSGGAGVAIAAYPAGGVTAGDLQSVINALADRITALEAV